MTLERNAMAPRRGHLRREISRDRIFLWLLTTMAATNGNDETTFDESR